MMNQFKIKGKVFSTELIVGDDSPTCIVCIIGNDNLKVWLNLYGDLKKFSNQQILESDWIIVKGYIEDSTEEIYKTKFSLHTESIKKIENEKEKEFFNSFLVEGVVCNKAEIHNDEACVLIKFKSDKSKIQYRAVNAFGEIANNFSQLSKDDKVRFECSFFRRKEDNTKNLNIKVESFHIIKRNSEMA